MKQFAIAIDGPAGSGKSTVAKCIAKELGIIYVDTGAMYRAVGLFCSDRGIDLSEEAAVCAVIPDLGLEVRMEDGVQKIYLQGEDVSQRIRTAEAGAGASKVAAMFSVRQFLVEIQRSMAMKMPVVMDGRDIGTNVLPNALVKVYLSASVEERANRRLLELREMGKELPLAEVAKMISERDFQDMNREHNPLRKAVDATAIDTTGLTVSEVVAKIVALYKQAAGGQ